MMSLTDELGTGQVTLDTVSASEVDLPFWKDPGVRAWVHGAITFGSGLLVVVIPVLVADLQGPTPLVPISGTAMLLLVAFLNYTYSRLGNKTVVTLSRVDAEAARVARSVGRVAVARVTTPADGSGMGPAGPEV